MLKITLLSLIIKIIVMEIALPLLATSHHIMMMPNSNPYDSHSNRVKRDDEAFVCITDGYFPDRKNCRVYHVCTSGIDTAHTCAEGTAWDPTKHSCNWENTVDCKKGLRKWDQITDVHRVTLFSTESANAWRKRRTTTTRPVIVVDSNFTCEYDADGYYADTKYCHIYHFCTIGVHTVLQCPSDLWFSTAEQGCEWPEKSDCKLGGLPTSSTSTIVHTETTEHVVTSTVNIQLSDFIYPIECENHAEEVVAHLTNCHLYYKCDNTTPVMLQCPERQLFDTEKRRCISYRRVSCGNRTSKFADKNPCFNKHDGIYADTERDCHFYYQCAAHNKLREAKCPGNYKFNVNTLRCGPAQNAPIPCGSFLSGNSATIFFSHVQIFIYIVPTMMIFTPL